jgi:3-hydroxyisobutyrate dehydrogenase-like beta-hydroxyacid dehydrogenase
MTQTTRPSRSGAKLGVIGLGIMGSLYARHLVAAGHEVYGYDVSSERLETFKEEGGHACGSVDEVIAQAEMIFVALSSLAAFEAVLIDPAGPASRARPGQIFVETGTIPIATKLRARDHVMQRGAAMLDTPVTGTRVHAELKKLVIYASGEQADFERVLPVMRDFANDVRYVGPFGAGMKLKIVTNLLVAVHNVAAAEALALAKAAGLDLPLVHELIMSGAAGSVAFDFRGKFMVEGRFEPATMRMDVFSKDLDIIGDFARSVDSSTPLFDSSALVYHAALDQGMRSQDVAAVFDVLSTHPAVAL